MAKEVSKENKQIAQYVAKKFGAEFRVVNIEHDDLELVMPVLSCADTPCRGVTSLSTVGLSDYGMLEGEDEYPVRIELVGACATLNYEVFRLIIATAAFCILRSALLIEPGSALPNVVREYRPKTKLPHLYFTSPYLWETDLDSLEFSSKTVAFLQAIPISESEYKYLLDRGSDELETLFESEQIDVFDLERPSVRTGKGKRPG